MKVQELEGAITFIQQKSIAQEAVVAKASADRDALAGALRDSQEALDQSTQKVQLLETEINVARAREQDYAQTLTAARLSNEELTKKLVQSDDWIFRLSGERVALERRLSEHAASLALLTRKKSCSWGTTLRCCFASTSPREGSRRYDWS